MKQTDKNKAARLQRQAEALRANISRRKDQSRQRQAEDETGDGPEEGNASARPDGTPHDPCANPPCALKKEP